MNILHHSVTGWNVSTKTIKGWGYDFIIRRNGDIIKGQGNAHTYGHNNETGFCFVGNYQKEQPTQAMIDSLIKLMRQRNDFDLKGHKDYANNPPGRNITACPGKNLYKLIPQIREEAMKNYKKLWKKEKANRLRLKKKKQECFEERDELKHELSKCSGCIDELEKWKKETRLRGETIKTLLDDQEKLQARLKEAQGLSDATIGEILLAIWEKVKNIKLK